MPVLRNTEKMDYADIEKALSEMGEKVNSVRGHPPNQCSLATA